jgi:hypothetical protein
VDRPWTGGFQDQARLGLFVLLWAPLGLWRLWFPCVAVGGVPRAAAVLPWPIPDPGVRLILLNLGALLVHSGYGWGV